MHIFPLDCKLKDTILHIKNLFRQTLQRTPLFCMGCPYCGAKRTCGRSHALLPDLIVPYLSHSLPMILSDYFHKRLTFRGICEKYLVSPSLIYRLKKLFLLHKK